MQRRQWSVAGNLKLSSSMRLRTRGRRCRHTACVLPASCLHPAGYRKLGSSGRHLAAAGRGGHQRVFIARRAAPAGLTGAGRIQLPGSARRRAAARGGQGRCSSSLELWGRSAGGEAG